MTDESIVKIGSSSNESKEEFKYLGTILTNNFYSGRNYEQIEVTKCLISFV